MKTFIAIAFYFPPGGGAGVQRTVKFVRYLPDFGWKAVVVAPPVETRSLWSPEDATLAEEVRASEVRRVEATPPAMVVGRNARLSRLLRLDTEYARWWRAGVADAALSGPPFEVIFVTMSPWMSGDAARELAERSGKPWVADLRDPWVFDEMQFYPSGIHRFLEGRRMKRMLSAADAVVMNTEEARARLLRRWPHLRRKRVEVITNGYDEADFAGPPPHVDEAKFRIVHNGHLHTELGGPKEMHARIRTLTGGRVRHVDFMTRSHVYLMQAVERVLRQRPDLRDRIEVHLAGGLSPADEAAITLDCVKTYGYINHAESVEVLRSADLLFLPMQNLPPGRRATIVPGKTYEYLASGRPILAALPDGDARDLLSRFERAAVVRPGDIDGMVHAILERVDIPREPDAPRVGLEQYERRDQARRLAELLAAVTSS